MQIQSNQSIFTIFNIITSVGYRVNSKQGTQFRQLPTQRLKDYLIQGYAINEKRLQDATDKFQDLKNAVKLAAKAINFRQPLIPSITIYSLKE